MPARRGVFLVFALISVGVLVSAGALLVLALVGGTSPSVPERATLYLKVDAPFSEVEPADVLSQFLRRPATLRSTVEIIRKAKLDPRITALVIRPSAAGALWAQLQEVRAALEDFQTSEKPITAFLESGGASEYYLASVADRVVLMPAGQLDVVGLASYELFFRGALDKVGIFPDLLHVGDYKTASNTFTERGFTPAHREMTQSLNRDWYDELVRAVGTGRRMPEAQAREALTAGPYFGEGAVKAGLVDELAYEDELDDTAPLQGTQQIDGEQYARVPFPGGRRTTSGRIALLYAVGTIVSGKSTFDSPGGVVLGSETFNRWLREVRIDPAIDAVVVRIDSPGGSAIASEVIWREMMLTREVKPVIVSMGDVAASGGYYIAAAADAIVAEAGTITGSIGVVTGKFVVKGALDKLGVGTAAVGDGDLSQIYSPFRAFSRAERARVEEQLQATYELFLRRVADGRHQESPKVDAVAQGRVWTGRQAREIGLVDELGGLNEAIRMAQQRAKLDPQTDVDVVVYPPRRTLYEVLSNPFGTLASTRAGLMFRPPELGAMDTAMSMLRLFRRGEPLAILPNVFVH